jgi:PAS domain S-box-containing protein
MRLARDISNKEMDPEEFMARAEALVVQYPELQAITWIDASRRIIASQVTPSLTAGNPWVAGEKLKPGDTETTFGLARDLLQPVYSQPAASTPTMPLLQLHTPLTEQGHFAGVILGEYSIDNLLRYAVPTEISAKYAVTLLDSRDNVLAGRAIPERQNSMGFLPWATHVNEDEVPVSPVGNGLILRAQAWRTSLGVVGSGLFWLVCALSAMTAWMLIANWRHTRRRMHTQNALVAETTFRRAMENSMLTGMRALDMQGRITYVNPAFCQMTGWSEAELVGRTAPFPYWPEEDHPILHARLQEELSGKIPPAGVQFRVKRKDGSLFDARLYVSPLIDALGKQSGWMTSMTDITEPNRIREQLSASYERFTTVLEALDASVSVAPLGSEELLFANKLYRLWFGTQATGHLQLVEQAGMPEQRLSDDGLDDVDGLAGLPTGTLTTARPENAEIYVAQLGKWLEVRSRYLQWTDGRLAQMVIATDITPRREAEELSAAQAERAHSASRLITMGEMASSVAHELNQPLTAINNYCNGMVTRIKDKKIDRRGLAGRTGKDVAPGPAGGPDHPAHPRLREAQRAQRQPADARHGGREAVELAEIELRRRNVRLTYHMAAAAARTAGRPDPDRAGAGQPAEERSGVHRHGRSDPRRAATSSCAYCPTSRRRRIEFSSPTPAPGWHRRGDGAPVRGLLLHQGRRHGHRAVAVPQHRGVAPRPDAGAEPLQWLRRLSVAASSRCRWIPVTDSPQTPMHSRIPG